MLISVVVITYNSSKYVVETLDSIYAQTYKDIELIISDDCSKDDTIKICKEWCNSHKERFMSVYIVESDKNTGIAPNHNRGYICAKGEWIKDIAGDDIMMPNCIEEYVKFSMEYPEYKILFSRAIPFGNNINAVETFTRIRDEREYFYSLPTSECQYWDLLIREACMDGPASFINKAVYDSLCGFDESIPMYEDYPFFLRAVEFGYRIGLLDKRVTKYRIHDESISYSTKKGKNLKLARAAYDVFKKYRYRQLKDLYPSYALLRKWFYRGQMSNCLAVRYFYLFLRVVLIVITRQKCLKVQNTNKVKKQIPQPLYREYCRNYFD